MSCLDCRRQLLISPRDLSRDQRAHIASCSGCARLAATLLDVDRHIADAALVPVPDGLAHRVLLARPRRFGWRHAGIAALALAVLGAIVMLSGLLDPPMFPTPVQAVGPNHPAVEAISLVVDDRAELKESGNASKMKDSLHALGLELKQGGGVHAYYGGKCHLRAGDCDLIVLDTPDARASVVLVPDSPVAERVLVTDRHKVALVTPAKAGSYVVVADSPKVARRMQRLFRRG